MNKQAFDRGFIKAAANHGINPLGALAMLKKAEINPVSFRTDLNKAFSDNAVNVPLYTGIGTVGGGLLGTTTGYLSGSNKDEPEKDHSLRNAALLGLAGAAGGGFLGNRMAGNTLEADLTDIRANYLGHYQYDPNIV